MSLELIILLVIWALARGNNEVSPPNFIHSQREGRFFPFYSVVRFENNECLGNCKLLGTCYTRRECNNFGGRPSGTCARGLGVCCIVQKSCGETSDLNNTYFQNPEYPSAFDGTNRCSLSISKMEENICQLRLDFLDMTLASPNGDGVCVNDVFTVTNAASRMPRICGVNVGQHVYIDFDGDAAIQLNIKTATASIARHWNIRTTQIPCDSTSKAPSGCLMYHAETSGSIKSFNYETAQNTRPDSTAGTREIANLMYGVCIAMAPNYCGIEWSQGGDRYGFTISGDTQGLDPGGSLGSEGAEVFGDNCTHDYVIIPNPATSAGVPLNVDRFCGNGFSTKRSFIKPFVLYVVTSANETNGVDPPDIGNRGFHLEYQQLACSDD